MGKRPQSNEKNDPTTTTTTKQTPKNNPTPKTNPKKQLSANLCTQNTHNNNQIKNTEKRSIAKTSHCIFLQNQMPLFY